MSVLAFDFGINSIGVAVGNEFTMSATPLEAVKARDGIPNADHRDVVRFYRNRTLKSGEL